MPAKLLIVHPAVRKKLQKLPLRLHQRIVAVLDTIQGNPLSGVKLHGELGQYRKLRLGDYRVIYHFNPKTSTVIVVKIEHRQGVYK